MSCKRIGQTVRFASELLVCIALTVDTNCLAECDCSDHKGILDGMRSARLQLVSGKVKGVGRRVLHSAKDSQSFTDAFSFDVAFDYGSGRVFCQREEPVLWEDEETQKTIVKRYGYQICMTPEAVRYVDHLGGLGSGDMLMVAAPGFKPIPNGAPIDVRTFGLADFASFDRDSQFVELIESISKSNIVSGRKDPEGRCVLSVEFPGGARVEYYVNCERGYAVERFEMRVKAPTDTGWSDIKLFGDLKWQEYDTIWLPIEVYMEKTFSGLTACQFSMDWESVNQDLLDSEFDESAFKLHDGRLILDTRLGGPAVVIGRTGNDEPPRRYPHVQDLEPKKRASKFVWIILGNITALVVIVLVYYGRRRR